MKSRDLSEVVRDLVLDRYYGKYEGVVTNVDDPKKLGRIKAKVPAVLGKDVESGWALPCAPFGGGKDRGMLMLPEVGDTVWMEFAAGQIGRPIWSGGFWGAPESTEGPDDLGTKVGNEVPTHDGKEAGPKRHILRTKFGHRLVLDDEGEVLVLQHGSGKALLRITKAGEVVVEAEKILFGPNAKEPLVLGNKLKELFNNHIHPTGVGPSEKPVQPMTGDHLSSLSSTE